MIAQPQGRIAVNPQTGERVIVAGPQAAAPAYQRPQLPDVIQGPAREPPPQTPLDIRNTETAIGSRLADDARADRAQTSSDTNQQRNAVRDLRQEFASDPQARQFSSLKTTYEAMRRTGEDGTPQSDIALIFQFMRALDPGSVVREAEYATAQNAAGVPDQIRNAYNRLVDGTPLNPEQRTEMLRIAEEQYNSHALNYNERAGRFAQMAGELGVPRESVYTHIPQAPVVVPLDFSDSSPTRTNQSTGNQEWGRGTPDNASLTRDVPDPVLRGHATRLGQMLASPRTPDEQIRAYVSEYFPHNSGTPEIEAAIRDRRNPRSDMGRWIRQNRGKPVIMGSEWYTRQEDRPNAERNLGMMLDSPGGTAVASYVNSATAGLVPPIAEGIGAIDDANNARAGLAGLRDANPRSALIGDIAGVVSAYAGGRAALGAAAPNLAARLGARPLASGIGADALYGGVRGAAESPDNALMGAIQGATVNAAVGGAARGGVRVGSRAAAPTGGNMAPLYAEGVQPSMGQRAGGVVNRAEQAFASVPVLGAAQRSTRERAIEQFERSVFNRALRNIPEARAGGRPARLPDDAGPGTAAWDHSYRAFDQAYNSVHSQMRFRLDGRVQQSLVQAQQQAARLHPDSAQRFANILDNDVIRVLSQNGGQLTGGELQSVLSNIRSTVRNVSKNPSGDQEFVAALEGLEDALMRGAVRHSPRAAIRDLRRIDRGYAQLMRAERAAMSGSANRGPGRFSATDLQRAERATGNRRRFLRGDQEGANYAEAGQRLGQNVGDSGTGERAAYMAGGLGMIGGSGAAGGVMAGMSPLALLGLVPYAANTIGNMPGVRVATNALLAPRQGPLANGVRANMQRFGEPLAGASAPAISDPWFGADY